MHPKSKLREGLEKSIVKAQQEMLREMTRISSESDIETEKLGEIARTAALLWIECGMHRCRIHFRMSRSDSKPLRSGARGRGKSQELVVKPEMRKAGDDKGSDFECDEIFTGCDGHFSKINGV